MGAPGKAKQQVQDAVHQGSDHSVVLHHDVDNVLECAGARLKQPGVDLCPALFVSKRRRVYDLHHSAGPQGAVK